MYWSSIGTALGEKKIEVASLFDHPGLIEKTGIKSVYQTNKTTVELAAIAFENLQKEIHCVDFDLCLLVTQSPDDFLPANAISLTNRLGKTGKFLAFDMVQGCSGFVQALCLCEKLLAGYPRILLVTADRYRSKLNKTDRSTNAVFSDGATATLLKPSPTLGIIYEDHFTDGGKRSYLYQSIGDENSGCLHMSGAELWMFTKLNVVPQIVRAIDFCIENNKEIENIYIHQASRVVVEGIKNSLPAEYRSLLPENYFKYANTVSSSIPLLLNDFPIKNAENKVSIFAGFGVGLTSSVIVYGKKDD